MNNNEETNKHTNVEQNLIEKNEKRNSENAEEVYDIPVGECSYSTDQTL